MSVEEFGDHVCKRCPITIPEDRTYCDKHYKIEMEKYQRAHAAYQEAQAEWDQLNDDERERAHRDLDQRELTKHAMLGALIILIILHVYFELRPYITAVSALITSGVIYLSPLISRPLGRVARGISRGFKAALIIGAVVTLITMVVESLTPSITLSSMGMVCGLSLGLWRELRGDFTPDATPREPARPPC